MIRHMAILVTQMMALLAAMFMIDGMAWLTQGYGVHPVAAGFMTCLLLITPHLIPKEHIL